MDAAQNEFFAVFRAFLYGIHYKGIFIGYLNDLPTFGCKVFAELPKLFKSAEGVEDNGSIEVRGVCGNSVIFSHSSNHLSYAAF